MEVYIEYVVLDNLIINYVLLSLTSYSLKLNAKKSLCVVSSMFGTVCAILFPFIKFNFETHINILLLFLCKMLVGLIMVLIIKKPKNFQGFIVAFFLLLTYTFILGGMCYGMMCLFNVQTTFSGIIMFGFEIPVSLFLLLGLCYLKVLFALIKIVKHKANFSKFYYDVKLSVNNRTTYVTGFLDSGNQVKINDGAVVVINYKTLLKLYPNLNVANLVVGKLSETGLKNAGMINVSTADGNCKMLTFTLDELQIIDDDNKVINLKNTKIGLAKTNFYGKFDCLLSPELFV